MANAKTNDNEIVFKITFKKSEKMYAQIFKQMYNTPTAILKDYIFRDVNNYIKNNNISIPIEIKQEKNINTHNNEPKKVIDF